MDNYKENNRAMAIDNQKLRQHLAQLKNEVLFLNRQLMAEQQNSRNARDHLLYFVKQISKCCADAVQGMHEEITDLNDDENKENGKSSIHRKTEALRRSIQLVQPTFRQDQSKDSGDEKSPPEDLESRRRFVQVRRRAYNETSFDDETENDRESHEIDDTDLPVSSQIEEQEAYTPHLVSVIPEENTKDFTKSSYRELPEVSVHSVNHGTQPEPNNPRLISSASSTDTDSSVVSFRESSSSSSETDDPSDSLEDISQSEQDSFTSRVQIVESSNEFSRQPTLRQHNGTIHSTFMELTNLHAFSTVSLACSTPRKRSTSIETRDCIVRLKKLTPFDLIQWGVKLDGPRMGKRTKNRGKKATSPRKKKRKSMSPKTCQIRISVPRVSSPHPSFNANCSRPRRNAAPANLQEPGLRRKMRRNC